ncbi:MAG: sugar kinase [Comamonadaceae bacterium]|nr:sugar kinase [Comamonadaceae bacterium]
MSQPSQRLHDRKHMLVVRRTRLDELVRRQGSLAQARFYIERLDADFGDYLAEHQRYQAALAQVHASLQAMGRYQVIERDFLPNVVFGPDDLVIALGPDGLVANTLKYLQGQPLIGVNPEPARWDGLLLPFAPADLPALLKDAARRPLRTQSVTMAEASLSDGQRLLAVNDLFIGAQSHVSAQYRIRHGEASERQSSSGVIVSTGLGASGWMRSVLTGARRIAGLPDAGESTPVGHAHWGDTALHFAVREPFPSRHTQVGLVMGRVDEGQALCIESLMAEGGVIFSDGMEADRLHFGAGTRAHIQVAAQRGLLVV